MNDLRDTERRLSNLLHETTPEPPASIDLHALARTAKTPSRRTSRDVVRRWAAPLIAAASVLGVIAGGAAVVIGGSTGTTGPDTDQSTSPEVQQAHKVIAHWQAAVRDDRVLAVLPTMQQVGEWEPALAAKYARALAARSFAPFDDPPLPRNAGEVTWADGEVDRHRQLASMGETVELMSSFPTRCAGCAQLEVSGAALTKMTVQTMRGTATVPAWRFSFKGTRVQVLHSALPAPLLQEIPQSPTSPVVFLQLARAVVEPDDRTITAEFTGGPVGNDYCAANYAATAVEAPDAVVIVITMLPRTTVRPSEGQGCTDEGHARSAKVVLRDGLGNRPVIQLRDGIPALVVHK